MKWSLKARFLYRAVFAASRIWTLTSMFYDWTSKLERENFDREFNDTLRRLRA